MATQNVVIDHEKCMGCKACMDVCPIDFFSFHDKDGIRTFSYGTECAEDCRLCENTCAVDAINLTFDSDQESTARNKLDFLMVNCRGCQEFYETQRMAEKVYRSLSEKVHDLRPDWITLCPDCKQIKEAEQIVGKQAELH